MPLMGLFKKNMTAKSASNTSISEIAAVNLCWKDSPPVQQLLDAVARIIASEYTAVAKENPALFSTGKG